MWAQILCLKNQGIQGISMDSLIFDVANFFCDIYKEGFFQSHFSGAIPYWDFPTTMKS